MSRARLLRPLLAVAVLLSPACATDREEMESQVEYHYNLGVAHLQDNNPQAALVQFRDAVKADKDNVKARYAMGHTYYILGDLEAAEENMTRVLKVDRDNGDAINYLGNIYERQGQLEKAAATFRKATESETFVDAHLAYRNLARVHRALNMEAEAEADLQAALTRVPVYYEARADLAKLYMDQARWDDAVAQWSKLLDLSPDVNDAHFYLGRSYLGKGDADQARRELATFILQADKGHPLLIEAKDLLQKLGGGG